MGAEQDALALSYHLAASSVRGLERQCLKANQLSLATAARHASRVALPQRLGAPLQILHKPKPALFKH